MYTSIVEIESSTGKELLVPGHKHWKDFHKRLMGIEGCNLVIHPDGQATWQCSKHIDRPIVKSLLKKYKNIDIDNTLLIYLECGGACDCGVLFAVEEQYYELKEHCH